MSGPDSCRPEKPRMFAWPEGLSSHAWAPASSEPGGPRREHTVGAELQVHTALQLTSELPRI